MGGKGRKRREKNYRAAHGGGHTRLPPPPDPSQVDALPSKLRKLMSFASRDGSSKVALEKRKRDDDGHNKDGVKNVVNEEARRDDSDNEIAHSNETNEKTKKKKRKRKQVSDLRFQTAEVLGSSKRKERKKKYLEEKKKKKKKKAEMKDVLDFPGHESIRFGEVVEAPPKLAVIPKAFKSVQNASQERLRLKAIEDYRNRKGWSARPGLHLPPPVTTSPQL